MSETAVVTWEIHFYVSDRRRRRRVEQKLGKLKDELTELLFDFLVDDETISCMLGSFHTMMQVIDLVGRNDLSAITSEVSDVIDGTRTSSRATLGWDFHMESGSIKLGRRE